MDRLRLREHLPPDAGAKQAAARTALLIGGDEIFRLALAMILRARLDCGAIYEIGAAEVEVGTLTSMSPVDLTILEMDGIEDCGGLLSVVRSCYPQTRVVVVSQRARRDDVLDALRAGAHGFLPKGIGIEDMVHALTVIASGTLWIPRSLADDTIQMITAASPPVVPACPPSESPSTTLTELTPRQLEVLEHIVQGKSNKQIARLMSLREGTVKVHVAGLLRNLGVSNRSRAAAVGSHQLRSRSATGQIG